MNPKSCPHFKELGGKREIRRQNLKCKHAQPRRMCRRCPAAPDKIKTTPKLPLFSEIKNFPDDLDMMMGCLVCPQYFNVADNIGSYEWLGRFNVRVYIECPFCGYLSKMMLRIKRPPSQSPEPRDEGKRVSIPEKM